MGLFYPPEIKGYNELKFHSQHFNTVENNSSFYRISKESTYKTWYRMTSDSYKFSMKLNKLITHQYKLELNSKVREKVRYILFSTQILKDKLRAVVIQLPASFKLNTEKLDQFLSFFKNEIELNKYKFDVAIEFRSKDWFIDEIFTLLKKHNVGMVAA